MPTPKTSISVSELRVRRPFAHISRRLQAPTFKAEPKRTAGKSDLISEEFKRNQRVETLKNKSAEQRRTETPPPPILGTERKPTGGFSEKREASEAASLERAHKVHPKTSKNRGFAQTAATNNMADDKSYEEFLNKASGGGGGDVSAKESKSYRTKSVNREVPKALQSVEEFYTSDADEPFEVVSLGFKGSDVSADELKSLIGHDADVSNISEKDFDPQGQYEKVIDAVKKAGAGKVKVFRVEHGNTRAEYYVVSIDEKEGRLVGLKALSVES